MTTPLEHAAAAVLRALDDPGSHPTYHLHKKHELRDGWPALWHALQMLRDVAPPPMARTGFEVLEQIMRSPEIVRWHLTPTQEFAQLLIRTHGPPGVELVHSFTTIETPNILGTHYRRFRISSGGDPLELQPGQDPSEATR